MTPDKTKPVFFITTLQLKWISENNHWMNQSFHGHWFISMNIFTDFTSERGKNRWFFSEYLHYWFIPWKSHWFSFREQIDLINNETSKSKSTKRVMQIQVLINKCFNNIGTGGREERKPKPDKVHQLYLWTSTLTRR